MVSIKTLQKYNCYTYFKIFLRIKRLSVNFKSLNFKTLPLVFDLKDFTVPVIKVKNVLLI
nr:hypothetical protein [uncultured bacterium]